MLLALSGGLDSSLLLNFLVALQIQTKPVLDFRLRAMHIHHGLSPKADEWVSFCQSLCAKYQIPVDVVHVHVDRASNLGIEAAARQVRYQALNAELESGKADYIVLAHHRDDQAETVLLQLLRGAGAKGLSAMAPADHRRRLLRPFLNISRSDLLACAKARNISWVEDESNASVDFDRNFLRHEVIPLLDWRFPNVSASLARSADHMSEASALLDDLAELDAGGSEVPAQLEIARLAGLSIPRAKNLLRWWLSGNRQPMPSAARLDEMLRQLLNARPDAQIRLPVDAGNGIWLRRYRGFALLDKHRESQPYRLVWRGEQELHLPDGNLLVFQETPGMGVALKHLTGKQVIVTRRTGGESFKPDVERPARTLKHLLQEAGIPAWSRSALPLIYLDDVLAVVPGVGVACSLVVAEGESGLTIVLKNAVSRNQ